MIVIMKNKLIISAIFLLFILANAVVYKLTSINQEQRIRSTLESVAHQLEIHYELQIYHQTLTADAVYRATISKKGVIEILKKALHASKKEKIILRKQLYDLLIQDYQIATLQGVLQFQFNLPNNVTFLRLHKPLKFDDDLSKIRYSYTYVNKEHNVIRGLEQGKTTHGFRNVYPIFDEKGNYLSAVELSFSSDLIQEMLTRISKIHTHFIVDKKVIEVRAWKSDDFISTYKQSDENENYMMSQMKGHRIAKHFDHYKEMLHKNKDFITQQIQKNEKFNFYELYEKASHIISFYPIKNIKDKKVIAWLVAYQENTFINETINNTLYIRALSLILFTFLSFFTYFNLSQKKILKRKVKNKTKKLKHINKNLKNKIEKEVEKNKQTQQQLFKAEKMASLGEMIGNIAHQWRQPLSIISTAATGMLLQKEFGQLDEDQLIENCSIIDENAQYLSKTIDDFRDFIKGNKKSTLFEIQETIKKFLHLIEPSIKNHDISIIITNEDEAELENYQNELIQCFINIYNNSRDILKTMQIKEKLFFISVKEKKDFISIHFKDNAGGINEKIISKIFEPYFTTKHKSQGTGLGLHMTYNLIVHGMKGTIEVQNVSYTYEENNYNGAEFIITLPKRFPE